MKHEGLTKKFLRYTTRPTIARDIAIGVAVSGIVALLGAIGADLKDPQTQAIAGIALFCGLTSIPILANALDVMTTRSQTQSYSSFSPQMM